MDKSFKELPFQQFCEDLYSAENELRKLKVIPLEDIGISKSMESVKFWAVLRTYELNGTAVFKVLADYALTVLSLPVSNSYVERTFSILTFMKDRFSNRMGLPLLNSLILLKTHLQANIFSFNFKIHHVH